MNLRSLAVDHLFYTTLYPKSRRKHRKQPPHNLRVADDLSVGKVMVTWGKKVPVSGGLNLFYRSGESPRWSHQFSACIEHTVEVGSVKAHLGQIFPHSRRERRMHQPLHCYCLSWATVDLCYFSWHPTWKIEHLLTSLSPAWLYLLATVFVHICCTFVSGSWGCASGPQKWTPSVAFTSWSTLMTVMMDKTHRIEWYTFTVQKHHLSGTGRNGSSTALSPSRTQKKSVYLWTHWQLFLPRLAAISGPIVKCFCLDCLVRGAGHIGMQPFENACNHNGPHSDILCY